MKSTSFSKKLKWSKSIPVIANILSAILFITAYAMKPVIWFIVAAGVNLFVAVAIILLFNKFEKRYSGIINKSENKKVT